MEEKFKQRELYLDYMVFRLVSNEKYDYIQSYKDFGRVFPRGTLVEEIYNLEYYEYLRPEKK